MSNSNENTKAMAANPLAAKLAGQMHINVSWGQWAIAAIVPGIASLVLIPLVLYKLHPPKSKRRQGLVNSKTKTGGDG